MPPNVPAPNAPRPQPLRLSSLESPLAKLLLSCLEDAKAEDVVGIDLTGRTTLADMMFVATGRSSTHVGAIAERIVKACREAGLRAPRIEGQPVNDWVLIDVGDAIVHIFRPRNSPVLQSRKAVGARAAGGAARARQLT